MLPESIKKLVLFVFLLALCMPVFAVEAKVNFFSEAGQQQVDSAASTDDGLKNLPDSPTMLDQSEKKEKIPSKEYKPEIGAGLGHYQFFGDVRTKDSRSDFAGSIVYSFYGARRLTNWLDFGLRYSTGVIVGSENGPERNLNFKSILHEGSIYLAYDFSNFFDEPKILRPYFSLGVSVFDFNSKGDLKDADGNEYHYWQDGSIRTASENSPEAASAVQTRRDYLYETDLRKADLDGFGRYRQVGFGIPIGFELAFRVTSRFSFRIGSVFTYSFTDLLDNVTDKSVGNRTGSKGGDHFLQNKLSIHYDLFKKIGKVEVEDFEFVDYLALDVEDDDKDGVINEFDSCPYTLFGVGVDDKGCPKDLDQDGIPDFLDKENNTAFGVNVNEQGVTLQDSDYLSWYLKYIDSTSVSPEVLARMARKRQSTATYRIFLKEYEEGALISDQALAQFASEMDVKVFTGPNNESVYTAGAYASKTKAEERKKEVVAMGNKDARVVVIENGQVMSVEEWENMADVRMKDRFKEEFEKVASLEQAYVVKLGTTSKQASALDKAKYLELEESIILDNEQGNSDYVIGPFKDTASANAEIQEFISKGFVNAELAKVVEGQVVEPVFLSMTAADTTAGRVGGSAEKSLADQTAQKGESDLDLGEIVFKVQVGAFKDFSGEGNDFQDYKHVEVENYGDYKRVLVGKFYAYDQAKTYKDKLIKTAGYKGAFVVAYQKGKRLSTAGHQSGTADDVMDSGVKQPQESHGEPVKENPAQGIQKVPGLVIRVQIGLYQDAPPSDVLSLMQQLDEKVIKKTTPQGIVRYLVGEFDAPMAATAYKELLRKKGFKGAFLVAYYQNEKISIKQALEMIE